jgi:hypothetical protein
VDSWDTHLSANEGSLSVLTEIFCRTDSYISRHEVFMLYVTLRFRPVLTKVCIEFYPDPNSYRTFLIIPTSRPTDATRDRFLFCIYTYTTLHVLSIKRPSSGVPHCTYSLQFLILKLFFKWVLNIKTLKLLKLLKL